MRIGKIASSVEYRIDEQFQNCQFLEPNFDSSNWKKSQDILIFQFENFDKFFIWEILKICNLANLQKIQFGNFQ